jgi:hypothetical protein
MNAAYPPVLLSERIHGLTCSAFIWLKSLIRFRHGLGLEIVALRHGW